MNIICVNHKNYLGRGDEYVNALSWGIDRHLKAEYRLHVITEKDVPEGIEGWWSKILIFQPGRFKGRCLFLDLDTVICGDLSDIAAYDGDLCGLDDFYRPGRFASGLMAFDPEKCGDIWLNYERAGFPQFDPNGDQGFIESMMPETDRWQTVLPGQVVSFKAHCIKGIPEKARVICFHGLPRPHTLREVIQHW